MDIPLEVFTQNNRRHGCQLKAVSSSAIKSKRISKKTFIEKAPFQGGFLMCTNLSNFFIFKKARQRLHIGRGFLI